MDREEKRLDVALNVIGQQITLATAIIGAVIAFSEQIAKAGGGDLWRMLPWALTPLVISIVAGVVALMGISFHLKGRGDPLVRRGVRYAGIAQNFTFLVAMVMLVIVVARTSHRTTSPLPAPPELKARSGEVAGGIRQTLS